MNLNKRKKLEAAGWKVGSTADFLALTEAEATIVEMRSALASAIRKRRLKRRLTQIDLAKRIGSSQSRVGKIEAADRSVSIELLVKSLVSLGATRRDIAETIGAGNRVTTSPKLAPKVGRKSKAET